MQEKVTERKITEGRIKEKVTVEGKDDRGSARREGIEEKVILHNLTIYCLLSLTF